MGRQEGDLTVGFTQSERDRVVAFAETRNLGDGTFLRLLVAGVLTRGAGMVDQYLSEGEKVLGDSIRVQARIGRDYAKEWPTIDSGHRQNKHRPEWRLKNPRKQGQVKGFAHDDKTSWWYLYNVNQPARRWPMGFTVKESTEAASRFLEDTTHADLMAALVTTPTNDDT